MNAFGWKRITASALPTLWLALLWLVADQVTKSWAQTYLMVGEPVPVLPHLNWTLAYNYGAAFSFLADHDGWQVWFFSILALVVSTVLLIWLARLPRRWTAEVVGLNLILGGAIGNVIDRIQAGRVTDFIDFYIGSWHYATFNVADVAISLGAFLLILSEFWLKPRAKKRAQALDDQA
jgi:signal peptidase II